MKIKQWLLLVLLVAMALSCEDDDEGAYATINPEKEHMQEAKFDGNKIAMIYTLSQV